MRRAWRKRDFSQPAIPEAIARQDVAAFTNAYRLTLNGCYGCHKASGKTLLRPQIPAAPTVHIINLDPQPGGRNDSARDAE